DTAPARPGGAGRGRHQDGDRRLQGLSAARARRLRRPGRQEGAEAARGHAEDQRQHHDDNRQVDFPAGMKNPFRTEAAAFHFLWGTIVYFGLIAIASLINTWAGLAVFLVETAILVGWWLTTRGDSDAPEKEGPPPRPPGDARLLGVATETVGGSEPLAERERRAAGRRTEVLVVTPALNSPLRHWVSDEDGAREAAAARLEASLEAMRAAGMTATGEVGDSDPVQAIADAIRTFAPDEIVISTHPEGRSNWLERGVVESAKERFDVPVTHVVVDLEAARAEPAASSERTVSES